MRRWTFGTPRRGLVLSFVWIAIGAAAAVGGITLAQTAAVEMPSTIADPPAPNAPPPAIAVTPAPNTTPVPPPISAAVPPAPLLTRVQLEQLVAPIALYPDPLLAQVLMASTYPLEVVEAARWVSAPANRGLSSDMMTNALQAQNWDPSIKALVPFPRVLQNLSDRLQWTEELGNAFLAQQVDVMAAVQSLRQAALAAGNLKQTPQCRCLIHASGEIISILPAEPQVVCVPVYRPAVYGRWPYPAYPPDYFPVPVGFAYPPGFWIGFEPPIELAVFRPFWGWGWFDWGHHLIAVDAGRYALASGGHPAFTGGVWVHNPLHRGGVAYADPATRARFEAARVSALTAGARSAGAGRDVTPAARFAGGAGVGLARSEATHSAAGRSGAAAIHRDAAISHSETALRGQGAMHSRMAFAGEARFHNAAAAHGGAAAHAGVVGFHGGVGFHRMTGTAGRAFHSGPAAFGAHPAFHAGGLRGGGAPHFAMGGGPPFAMGGGAHGGGAPHGGGRHDGGGPGGHHG